MTFETVADCYIKSMNSIIFTLVTHHDPNGIIYYYRTTLLAQLELAKA